MATGPDLASYFRTTLPRVPESLTAHFDPDSVGMWIESSGDHKMRTWVWNLQTGGTMPSMIQ
jgi:hypothetical protein